MHLSHLHLKILVNDHHLWLAYAYPNKWDYNHLNSNESEHKQLQKNKYLTKEELIEENKYFKNENDELRQANEQLRCQNRKLIEENELMKLKVRNLQIEAGFS